jgi:hypothetical protein
MKLAEALAERSDCQRRLEELKKRALRSARVQEGEPPAEDSDELLAEVDRVFARLRQLITAINRTNAQTAFVSGQTISDAIAVRELLGKKRELLAAVAEAAGTRQAAIQSRKSNLWRRSPLRSCRSRSIACRRNIGRWTRGSRN